MELNGKVAVVTGSGRGLGLAYAEDLAAAGAAVVVNDVDAATAEAAVKAITDAGGRAVAEVAAVGSTDAAAALVERAVSEFGRLDVMVTNAGVLRDAVLWKMSDDDFDTVIGVHLRGTFTCARAAAVRFREQGEGGRIICVGSPTGQRGNFGQTNYAAAKAGIVGMVRTWAMELARANVTVNAVIPVAATAMTDTIPALRPYVDAMRAGEPMPPFARRALAFGTPRDAAGLVTFLASDAAAGITGQAIGVGGDRVSLWTHPVQAAAAYHDAGWPADALAEVWPTVFADQQQSVGEKLPEPPGGRSRVVTASATGLDLDALEAIDVHAHVEVDAHGHLSLPDEFLEASSKYFAAEHRAPSLEETAAYYRERRMAVVVFTVDIESATGHAALSNEEIADAAARHRDVLIPFASVDPAKGRAGARTFRRLVEQRGMRGIKFHPSIQGFAPDDRSAYPLLEVAQELGVPALFHTGQTGIGAGMPGGGGIRLSLSNPMLLDNVAVDFPELTIIMAHPSFPWQDEALAVATHKPKVYIDLSGWSPKYFPPQLVRYANTLLQDKVLFGSDYPLITPDRWRADFAQLDIKDHVRPKIMKENAVRALGLDGEGLPMTTTVSFDDLPGLAGTPLGTSDWLEVDQERINLFADATDDHQWIHTDPERAKDGPFGGPIAHGYLTLSLLIPLFTELLEVEGVTTKVNYGLNKVRFPAPVPAGSAIRLTGTVTGVEEVGGGGVQITADVAVEIRGGQKPACVAQPVLRFYR